MRKDGGEWTVSRPNRIAPGERAPVPIEQVAECVTVLVRKLWRAEKSVILNTV